MQINEIIKKRLSSRHNDDPFFMLKKEREGSEKANKAFQNLHRQQKKISLALSKETVRMKNRQ